jgi:hypothetical protein
VVQIILLLGFVGAALLVPMFLGWKGRPMRDVACCGIAGAAYLVLETTYSERLGPFDPFTLWTFSLVALPWSIGAALMARVAGRIARWGFEQLRS